MDTAPALSSADHAAACLAWAATRDAATITAELGRLDHPLYRHAEALADAADSADEAVRGAGLGALFGGLVEPLNDSFRPAGRAAYARLFTRVVWRCCQRQDALRARLGRFGIVDEAGLHARYQALRAGGASAPATAGKIIVLSRVTVGADILLTTVAIQRLRQRYAEAEIVVLGDGKLAGLLGGFPGVRVRPLAYGRRGPLGERLASWLTLVDALAEESADLVVQPDSRLSQLGILPLTESPAATWLWENTLADDRPAESLALVLDRALAWWLGLTEAPAVVPRLALDAAATRLAATIAAAVTGRRPLCAVKLDHGGNPAKALPREAEIGLLRHLRDAGWRILLDRGFGPAELANSDELMRSALLSPVDLDDSGQGLGANAAALTPGLLAEADVLRFHGSIAGWAAAASACALAVSYDSVGHHLAAALGVPVVTAFTGHPDERFLAAWKPQGAGRVEVVAIATADKADPAQWQRLYRALPLA